MSAKKKKLKLSKIQTCLSNNLNLITNILLCTNQILHFNLYTVEETIATILHTEIISILVKKKKNI